MCDNDEDENETTNVILQNSTFSTFSFPVWFWVILTFSSSTPLLLLCYLAQTHEFYSIRLLFLVSLLDRLLFWMEVKCGCSAIVNATRKLSSKWLCRHSFLSHTFTPLHLSYATLFIFPIILFLLLSTFHLLFYLISDLPLLASFHSFYFFTFSVIFGFFLLLSSLMFLLYYYLLLFRSLVFLHQLFVHRFGRCFLSIFKHLFISLYFTGGGCNYYCFVFPPLSYFTTLFSHQLSAFSLPVN